MKKTGLNDIISMLSSGEFNDFGHCINNPLFNVPSRIKELYCYILKNYDNIRAGKIEREEAGRIILGGNYSDDSLRKLFSNFIKEIYRFMALAEFNADEDYRRILVLKQLKERGLNGLFGQKLHETKKYFSSVKDDEDRAGYMHRLYLMQFKAEPESEFPKYSPALQNLSDMLDYNYIIQKLYHYQLMFSKQYLNRDDIGYKKRMSGGIEEFIINNEEYIKSEFPEIYLKYVMLKMTEFKDSGLIKEYENFLESNLEKLTALQASNYYSDLYNFLTISIGRGDTALRKVFLGLVKKLDSKSLLVSGKIISYYSFKQITDTCIFMKDTAWLEYFLDKYTGMLNDINRKNIINLAYAKLYYYKKETGRARTGLAKVDYKDFIHYLDAKLMLACIEFDEENYAEVISIIENVRIYIKKNRHITPTTAETNLLFAGYLTRLVKVMENSGKNSDFMLEELHKEIENKAGPVYARAWLEDVIDKLRIERHLKK